MEIWSHDVDHRPTGRRRKHPVCSQTHRCKSSGVGNGEQTMTFAPGDIVMLKSGGQSMTVVSVSEDDVHCLWIGDEGELYRETIPAVALESLHSNNDDDEDDDEEEEEDD